MKWVIFAGLKVVEIGVVVFLPWLVGGIKIKGKTLAEHCELPRWVAGFAALMALVVCGMVLYLLIALNCHWVEGIQAKMQPVELAATNILEVATTFSWDEYTGVNVGRYTVTGDIFTNGPCTLSFSFASGNSNAVVHFGVYKDLVDSGRVVVEIVERGLE